MKRERPLSIYAAIQDEPETISELIGDYCQFKKLIGEAFRSLEDKIDRHIKAPVHSREEDE